jgi:hypothetical protein
MPPMFPMPSVRRRIQWLAAHKCRRLLRRQRAPPAARDPLGRDRRGGGGPGAAARNATPEAATHGRLRALGDGLRDRALAGRHLLVGLSRQPRQCGGDRDRRRPDCRHRARRHGEAHGVDGNRLGTPGRPRRGGGEHVAKSKNWPDSPRALAGRLRRAATQSAPSATNGSKDFAADASQTIAGAPDDNGPVLQGSSAPTC